MDGENKKVLITYTLTLFNPIPGGGGQNCPPLSNFFNFLEIGRSYSSDVFGLLVFILWPHFRQFSCIYTSLTKSYEHFVTSTQMFSNIFNFFADVSIVLYPLLQLFYFYYIMLYSVCLLSEKKRSASLVLIHDCLFFPNLHISKKFHVPAIFPITSSKH